MIPRPAPETEGALPDVSENPEPPTSRAICSTMLNTMKNDISTTIDAAGRLVVPKEIRDAAGLAPGVRLAIRFRGGLVEIEPEPREVRIEQKGALRVAVPVEDAPPLDRETVAATREAIRAQRGSRR